MVEAPARIRCEEHTGECLSRAKGGKREQNAGMATRRQTRLEEAPVGQRDMGELLRAKQAEVVEWRRGD